MLVAGAGLMIRSFMRISAVDLGFNPDGLLTMEVLPLERNSAAHKEYYTALLQQIRTIPGIASVGLVDNFRARRQHRILECPRGRQNDGHDGVRRHARLLRDDWRAAAGRPVAHRRRLRVRRSVAW